MTPVSPRPPRAPHSGSARNFAFAALAPALAVAALGVACRPAPAYPGYEQGIVGFDERAMAFDLPGRVTSLAAEAGDRLAAGAEIARLDDSLDRARRDAQAAVVEVAQAQLALARAGARAEELGAARAQADAARAQVELADTEIALAEKSLARVQALAARGDAAPQALDEAQARLDGARARREAARAQAEAAAAQAALVRAGARREQVEAAARQVEAAQAALAVLDRSLTHHVLVLPAAGLVLERHVLPGEVVGAGAPVVTVADTARPYADVYVSTARMADVRQAASCEARADGYAEAFSCKVEYVERRTSFTPRYLFSPKERANLVVRVRVRLDDPGERLHAGLPLFVRFAGTPDGG